MYRLTVPAQRMSMIYSISNFASFYSIQVIQLQKIAPRMHKNSHFRAKKIEKIFWKGTAPSSDLFPSGKGGHPHVHHIPLPSAPSASGSLRLRVRPRRLGPRGDCHGSYGVLATPLNSTIIRRKYCLRGRRNLHSYLSYCFSCN